MRKREHKNKTGGTRHRRLLPDHAPFTFASFALSERLEQAKQDGENLVKLACTQTLFYYFCFRSFRKHRRASAVNKSPAVFVFYHARSTDFEDKFRECSTFACA